jgi:MoaA/NifB/PqqE/SkfB family radical SAM enzyme
VYAFEEVEADAPAFRAAFARAEPFRPLYVKIKLIFGCNLRCRMCQHWRSARPEQLTTARLKDVLGELAELGCRKVHFTGGEPSLRPDLEELVAHAAERGLRVTLTTNATRLTRERARALVEGGLRGASVSIDGPDAAVHDAVRGVPGAWDEAVEGLKNLRKEARRGKLGLSINTVVNRLNLMRLDEMPALALRRGVQRLRLLPVDDHTGEGLRPGPEAIAAFNRDVAPSLARRALRAGLIAGEDDAYPFGREPDALAEGARGHYAFGYYLRRPCFAPHTHALIDHDGRVFTCCMQRGAPVLGDLRTHSFTAVWRGEAYRRVRALMRGDERLSACARCDDFLVENRRLHAILTSRARPIPIRPADGAGACGGACA